MTLFDPHSHRRILELRQEQLARKARRRQQIGLDAAPNIGFSTSVAIRAIAARLARGGRAASTTSRPSGRPALDS